MPQKRQGRVAGRATGGHSVPLETVHRGGCSCAWGGPEAAVSRARRNGHPPGSATEWATAFSFCWPTAWTSRELFWSRQIVFDLLTTGAGTGALCLLDKARNIYFPKPCTSRILLWPIISHPKGKIKWTLCKRTYLLTVVYMLEARVK